MSQGMLQRSFHGRTPTTLLRTYFLRFRAFLTLGVALCVMLTAATSTAATKKSPTRTAASPKHAKAAQPTLTSYGSHPQALAWAQDIAQTHDLDRAWVLAQLHEAKRLPKVIKLMQPAPAGSKKNWNVYRSRFVTTVHIDAGVAFWQTHQGLLEKAQAQFGVPAHIILGIIGVETIFGRNTGGFRVLDALATLAFDYPLQHPRRDARVAYFQGELGHFLTLSKKLGQDPASIKGSYAGAMGWPQFMPSSWLKHAVDFDGDGRIDLWHSPADIIGSVANYFKAYGWRAGQLTHTPYDPSVPLIAGQERIELENGQGESVWLTVEENFMVITKYNNSHYYAAAVIDLGAAIAQRMPSKP